MERGVAGIIEAFQRFENAINVKLGYLYQKIDGAQRDLSASALNAETIESYRRIAMRERVAAQRTSGNKPYRLNVTGNSGSFDSTAHELAFLREENAILREKCELLQARRPVYSAYDAEAAAQFKSAAALPGAWGADLEASFAYQSEENAAAKDLIRMSVAHTYELQSATTIENKALRDENQRLHVAIAALYAKICELQLALDRAEDAVENRINHLIS